MNEFSDPVSFLVLILVVFASARIGRLIFKDSLFDEPRQALIEWLDDPLRKQRKGHPEDIRHRHPVPLWIRRKIAYLIGCPYCVTAYSTLAAMLLWHFAPASVTYWFAAWMGAIVVLEYTDSD